MRIQYTDTALFEVEEILAYIAKDNPLAAEEVAAVIRVSIDRLASFPRLAIETDVTGVRVIPVLPYRYVVFYSVTDDAVIVRNVRHFSRDAQYFTDLR
jgi:toxin ParE1/3/4